MALNKNIKKVLVIGSGPIVIGQGAEFDYSGTQACESLKEEGVCVVLINSNPATIMTDKQVADKIYIEPLTVEFMEKIIDKERPDALIATMGGQTGLNLAVELFELGVLEKYGVNVIGTSINSIKNGEDRESFRKIMNDINQPMIQSEIVTSIQEGIVAAKKIGYPVVVRPAYTLGGSGGGIADDESELLSILQIGLNLSSVGQVLIEKSVKGWKEVEYEVIRDSNGNCITVCNMENIDPVGIHTGDSIVVAPSQTLSDKEYQMLRSASIKIINAIDIQGACNVQFALNAETFEYAVIEINPRVSRSSALASKATGYPIARVSAKIALGYNLDEIRNSVTGKTYACFEPSLDYVVVKIPKWPFDKFYLADKSLGTKMMATGEIMAIGNNFESALLKGIRSLEIGKYTLDCESFEGLSLNELKNRVMIADDERIFCISQMLRRGYDIDNVSKITGIDKFFIHKINDIVMLEEELKESSIGDLNKEKLLRLKKIGFSDKGIAKFLNKSPNDIYKLRQVFGIKPVYKMVDTCAGEFDATSSYYYSTYDEHDEVDVTDTKKVIVIGSGPIRIGQGVEFDYASVHCVKALSKMGIETIIINNNPETVSTDFDISDKLYFEPLTEEDVFNIIEKEKPMGVILQFGGQTAIKLAKFLDEQNINILGSQYKQIDDAEDREKFDEILENLNIKRPKGKGAYSVSEGIEIANELSYPVLIRPSYVLGGKGMEIIYEQTELIRYLEKAFKEDSKNPVLIDRYLVGMEIEVDAICDKEDILIPGIMEHLERAGVHSGDSITMYPSINISRQIEKKVIECTKKIATKMGIVGMINIQFVEHEGELYVIEVNPRASRTLPYISKVAKVPVVELATRVILGEKIKNLGWGVGLYQKPKEFCVKVPVFSTQKLPSVEMSLGPEMKSTGEVLGIGSSIEEALYKGFLASSMNVYKKTGKILATVNDNDKDEFLEIAKMFSKLGYEFICTQKTANMLIENNICALKVNKIKESRPNILDVIKNKEVDFVINTPTKANDSTRDGFKLRRCAIENAVLIMTSLDTARAMAKIMSKKLNTKDMNIFDMAK